MKVSGAGMDAAGPQRLVGNPGAPFPNLSPPAVRGEVSAGDAIATLLAELSQSNLARLMEIVDGPSRDSDPARADGLWSAAAHAIAAQHAGRALDLLREFAQFVPSRAEALPSSPEFTWIRSDLEQLLAQLTAAAKSRAEGRLIEASQVLDEPRSKDLSIGDLRPEVLLLVAGKLIEAGGLANYVRSEAASAALLDPARWVPVHAGDCPEDSPISAGWHVSWRLGMAAWTGCGIAAIAVCWYSRADYLAIVCGLWVAGLVLLLLMRRAAR